MAINSNNIDISSEILNLIAEIDEFKGAWRALGNLAPDRLSSLRRVASIESIGSSTRIEGSKLTDREVERLLSNLEIKQFETRDEQEVAGYSEVMDLVFSEYELIGFSENHIMQLHRDLLKYSEKDTRHRGNYKTMPNSVAAFDADGNEVGIVFETASAFDTPRLMQELVEWLQAVQDEGELHPLLIVAISIVVFLEIHPFQDGNGRLSRVLTTLLLLQSGYAYVPYSSLESMIENNKEQYYLALRQTQTSIRESKTNWTPWVLYFLRALQKQKIHLEKKLEREHLLIGTLPELSLNILQFIKEHGRANLRELVEVTAANRSTVKFHLQKLVVNKHLAQHGVGKGTWYSIV